LFKKNFYIAKCMHAGYRDIWPKIKKSTFWSCSFTSSGLKTKETIPGT
jgi:hypothetical protein